MFFCGKVVYIGNIFKDKDIKLTDGLNYYNQPIN